MQRRLRCRAASLAAARARALWPLRQYIGGMAILAEAGRTDDFLDTLEPARPDPRRARQISALVRPAWNGPGRAVAALATSAAVGFVIGYLQARGVADTGAVAQLLLGPQSLQEIGL